ncbi:19515_t:CDS:2 [Entrophospora sp. SA101]|nr:19515_t:CDS:2 [Entrophospora sp. SA101]
MFTLPQMSGLYLLVYRSLVKEPTDILKLTIWKCNEFIGGKTVCSEESPGVLGLDNNNIDDNDNGDFFGIKDTKKFWKKILVLSTTIPIKIILQLIKTSKRIIACLDVRTRNSVITKGDQYDIRESINNDNNAIDVNNNIKVTRKIRNFGKPVDLAPLNVAGEYFRLEADKVSINSDAVYAIEKYLNNGW